MNLFKAKIHELFEKEKTNKQSFAFAFLVTVNLILYIFFKYFNSYDNLTRVCPEESESACDEAFSA